MSSRELVCIVCPLGCRLTVEIDVSAQSGYKIYGNKCPRGHAYALKEMTAPTRMLPTTVKISGSHLSRLPVKTDAPIPKTLIFEAMTLINEVAVTAPIKIGDIVIENILGTGSNIVATRTMHAK